MLAETKNRTSRKWKGALIYLALLGVAPGAWQTSFAGDSATTNPVVGSSSTGTYSITKDAEIDVQAQKTEDVWQWFSALSGKKIVNKGDNDLTFTLTTEDPAQGMFLASNIVLQSDTLTLKPTVLDDGTAVGEFTYAGTTSGEGELCVDIGDNAVLHITGELGHAYTDVKSGTLDVSSSSASQVKLGGLTGDGAGIVSSGARDLIVDFDDDALTYNGALKGTGSGATLYKTGSGDWTMNLGGDSKVDSVCVQDGFLSLGENHYDGGSFVNNFGIVLEEDGGFNLTTEKGATITLDGLDASQGGTIQIGAKDALVLSELNETTTIDADLVGEGGLSLKNVLDEDGAISPWILSGNNSKWSGTISASDSGAEITLASVKSSSANATISFGSQGTLNVEKSTTLGALKITDDTTIDIASGKKLTLGDLALNEGCSWNDARTTLQGGGSLSIDESVGKNYDGAMIVKGGSVLSVISDGLNDDAVADVADGTTRRTTTLTEGGALSLDYSGDAFQEANSIWTGDVEVDGEGGITVKSKDANGAIDLSDGIAFVGEKSNNLTLTTENALVLLQNEFQGNGRLTKKGNGMAILDGSGALTDVTISQGVFQAGTSERVNAQLESADVLINGGSLTGWVEKIGSINLTSGGLATSGTKTVELTNSGAAFSISGGGVYVDVLDAQNYTNFKTTAENATVEIKSGSFYVDTATNGVELETGARLNVIESSAGNMTANVSKIAIYDDIAHKRFVVDADALNNGVFSLVLKDSNFSDYARTANQKNVARYVDKALDSACDQTLTDFFSALENGAADNSHALDQATGETRFSAMSAQLQTRNLIRQTLTREVLPSATVPGVDASALRGQTDDDIGFAGWMDVVGAFGDVHSHAGAGGYDYTMLGGIWGVELGSSTANQFGLYYSYNNSQADTKSALGKAKIGDNIFGLYLRANDSWGYTLGTGSLGVAGYKFDRYTSLPEYERQYFHGKTDGWSCDLGVERGFTFDLSSVQLQPFTGLQFTHLQADSFTESGTLRAVALRTDKTDYDSFQGTLGLRMLQSVGNFEWNAYVNWTHEYLDANPEGAVAMVGASGGKIRVVGNGAGRDWFYIGAGGTWEFTDSFDMFTGCDVQLNEYLALVNGNAGFRYRW